jgi:hypothetical protein
MERGAMIELTDDVLRFSFPEVHREADLRIHFQRTLRIPDDGKTYPLPAGLGRFPLRHVDDFAGRVTDPWKRHGGVMLPMYQSEALWVSFSGEYPFAVKVGAGKIDAVTGESWTDGLHRGPQDYVVVPGQPWLDGFAVEKGIIRQFVAMPLGSGYTVEEQITGKAEHGGLQVVAYPVRAAVWERMKRERLATLRRDVCSSLASLDVREQVWYDMGMAPGGRMRQEIYQDERAFEDWDTRHLSRCFVHLANSLAWRAITGEEPPTAPFTAEDYRRRGIPWFDWYDADRKALEGAEELAGLESVAERARRLGQVPLAENETQEPQWVREIGPTRRGVVREGCF